MTSNYTPLPWKKNIRMIPPRLEYKLKTINSDDVVVACVKKINRSDIQKGLYRHLIISISEEGYLDFYGNILPSKSVGKFSKINIEGKENKRKDLPMITKTFAVDTPNFGDWSYGSHTVYFDRDVYVKEYIPPKQTEISIELMSDNSNTVNQFVIKFSVEEVLNKKTANFLDDLFYNLNILQENVGNSDVFSSDTTFEEYTRTIYVDWEILPAGQRDSNLRLLISKFRLKTKEDIDRIIDRYDVLNNLRPKEFISGTSGFRRYFGAKFSDNLVVFENLEYGNAIYVMYDNWKALSQKTRIELLTGDNTGFDRIVHTKSWKVQLDYLIRKALNRPLS